MAFNEPSKFPDFADLIVSLDNSKIQLSNNALYQTIFLLIQRITRLKSLILAALNAINIAINTLSNRTFITVEDETSVLPNSVQLLPGTNVTFDDSVPNQRTINVAIDLDDFFTGVTIKTAEIEIPPNRRNGKLLVRDDFEERHVGSPVIISQAPNNESDMLFVQFVGEVIDTRQLRVYWMAPFGAPRKMKINYMIGA